MGHIVLLGDSIFDNERYVAGGPSVAEHLKRILPVDWKVTLLARDGAIAEGVARQLTGLPGDATHLVISVGGNNAIEPSAAEPQPDFFPKGEVEKSPELAKPTLGKATSKEINSERVAEWGCRRLSFRNSFRVDSHVCLLFPG